MIRRRVARVLLFDGQERLLLLFDPDPDRGAYWYPPGGRIERGETPEAAARRELVEEVGLEVADLGPVVLRSRARFTYGDRRFDQDEWHLLGRVVEPVVGASRPGDNEAAAVAAHRWWSLPELRISTDRFFPQGLLEIVERLRRPGPPAAVADDRVAALPMLISGAVDEAGGRAAQWGLAAEPIDAGIWADLGSHQHLLASPVLALFLG